MNRDRSMNHSALNLSRMTSAGKETYAVSYPLWAPDGNTWYDSLQSKVTQRLAHGLQGQLLFTWAKQLGTAAASNVASEPTATCT